MKDVGLIPLINFGEILPNLYRSAQPEYQYQYKWLQEKLGIKYIVNLRGEKDVDRRMLTYVPHPMTEYRLPVDDHRPPTDEQAQQFQRFIIDRHEEPVLIHCLHGHGRTSTFSVLAKMALGMSYEHAILDEQVRFGYIFRYGEQKDWLESYAAIGKNILIGEKSS